MRALPKILVIDDELQKQENIRRSFCVANRLKDVSGDANVESIDSAQADAMFCSGFRESATGTGDAIKRTVDVVASGWPFSDGTRWALVLLDRIFRDSDGRPDENFGYQILQAIVERWPDPDMREGNADIPVLMLTQVPYRMGGHKANPFGARAYVEKVDLEPERLSSVIDQHGLIEDAERVAVGSSLGFLKVLRNARQAGRVGVGNILLLGETGAGKTWVAPYIHRHSNRAKRTLLQHFVNAQSDPAILRDSLFGHWKGAFDGANKSVPGLAERAHKGTLFIDEVANLDGASQGELFQYAQHESRGCRRQVTRMGVFPDDPKEARTATQTVKGEFNTETRQITVDVLLITATNRSLDDPDVLAKCCFAEPLYHRLAGTLIYMPALRERLEDVPDLFLEKLSLSTEEIEGRWPKVVGSEVEEILRSYSWPGNIRELEKVARAVASQAKDWDEVLPRHIPKWPTRRTTTPLDRSNPLSHLASLQDKLNPESYGKNILRGCLPPLHNSYAHLVLRLVKRALEITQDSTTDEVMYQRAFQVLFGRKLTGPAAASWLIKYLKLTEEQQEAALGDPVISPALQKAIRNRRGKKKNRIQGHPKAL